MSAATNLIDCTSCNQFTDSDPQTGRCLKCGKLNGLRSSEPRPIAQTARPSPSRDYRHPAEPIDATKSVAIVVSEAPPRRQTFCSQACVDEWTVRSNPAVARALVWKRDQGICARCGLDTRGSGKSWEADHIVPVVEGGGECGLDNYRTLCLPCHRTVTAELRRRLAGFPNPESSLQLPLLDVPS